MSVSFFAQHRESAKEKPSYAAARLSLEFTEALAARMETLGMTQADLARAIGKSPAYVSRILNGDTNFTLETMAALAMAVDGDIAIRLCGRDDRVMWVAHTLGGDRQGDTTGTRSDDETVTLAA